MRQITFDNPGTNPDAETRVITILVDDGIAASNTANAIVQVAAVNNAAPVVDLDLNDSTAPETSYRNTFSENGLPVPVADGDTSITDLDSDTLASATITLTNPEIGDLLAVAGTLPVGIDFVYDSVTSTLTLTGTASLAAYQTALAQVRFGSAGDDPVAGTRIVEVAVSDGTNDSNAATALITVATKNDAPVITVNKSATYVENAAALVLSPLASVLDPDDTELNFASVEITQGSFPGDGDMLTVDGLASGSTADGVTFLWDPALHALVFNGAASLATYQSLLRQVGFQSTSDNPTDFNATPQRTLLWTVSDGTTPQTAATTIDIVARNDAPAVAVAANAAYAENDGPTILSPAASATDADSLNLTAGQVTIVPGALPGDVLTVNGLQAGKFAGIDFSYDAVAGSLFFFRAAPVADYQTFLQAVQFHSTSEDPTNAGADPTRTIAWALGDGINVSTVQTTILTITAVNDAPLATIALTDYGPVNEQALLSLKNTGISVADMDAGAGIVTATLSVSEGTAAIAGGSGASVAGSGTGTLTISGTAEQINALLGTDATSAVDYINVNDTPSPNVTLQLQVNDNGNTGAGGSQVSNVDTAIIHLTPLNDPPAVGSGTAGASNSIAYTEQAPPVLVDDLMTIVDPDSVDMVGATLTIAGAVAGDLLHFTNTANITGIYDPGTFTLTLTGLDSIANYEAVLQAITFDNPTSDDPTSGGVNPTRTVTWQVDDGTAVSNVSTTAIAFTAVNDAPVNTVPGPQSIQGMTPHAIAGLAVSDADAGAGMLTTTLAAAHGTLAVDPAGGAAVAGSGTGLVTLTGTVAQINTTLGAPGNVVYTGASPATDDDVLTMQTSDGGNIGTPGPLVDTDTIALLLGQESLVRPLGGGNFDDDHSGGYLMRHGDGTFLIVDVNSSQATVHILGAVGTEWTFRATGDFNGDGISDVLSQRWTDQMLHIHSIDANHVAANWFIGAVGAEWQFLGTGDFDHDGTSDLLWEGSDGTLLVHDMQDNFSTRTVILADGIEWSFLDTGDFNNDGTSDLLWERSDGRC